MAFFNEFDQLRNSINRMMGDFDTGLRGGLGGRGRRPRAADWDIGQLLAGSSRAATRGGGSAARDGGMLSRGRGGSCCANPSCPCGDNCSCGDQCRCGATTQQQRAWTGLGGFPQQIGSFWDDTDLLDLPLLVQGGGSGIGGASKKEEEELKTSEGGQLQRGGAQQQLATKETQQGTLQTTFKPQQIMRARINVEDLPDKFVVTAEMPGFDKSNVKINVTDDGLLTIKGEQTKEFIDQAADKKYLRAERSFANIQRSLRIPKGVDVSKICASYDAGVLHVNLPKVPESEKQKQEIQIQ